MAKKVNKTSSKVTKEDLVAQNEALGEQVAGLQEEVMDLVEENEELNDILDEQDEINNALQKSITAHVATIDYLDQRVEEQENLLQLADLVVDESDEYEALTEDEIAELKQDNHHLTIQLVAAKDKLERQELAGQVRVSRGHYIDVFTSLESATEYERIYGKHKSF